jgi:hypothetical protein
MNFLELAHAIDQRDERTFSSLVSKEKVNEKGSDGLSVAERCAYEGWANGLKIAIENGADPFLTYGGSPVSFFFFFFFFP